MLKLSCRIAISFSLVVISFATAAGLPACANGDKTTPKELVKYLNPFPKKQKYLNQAQDRVIKKKAFKLTAMPQAPAVMNRELGFFAVVPLAEIADAKFQEDLLARNDVNGLSVTLPWSQLEPSEDSFNWAPLDTLLSACAAHNKTLIVRVSTCGLDAGGNSDTPKWVFDAGVKSIAFTDVNGLHHTMPLFWDKDYLARWSNFISEFAQRYDKNTTIHSIGITGGGFLGGTSIVPPGKANLDKPSADGAKPEDLQTALKKDFGMNQRQLVAHWKYVADVFPKYFKNARLNFAVNAPVHGRSGEDALDEIADYLVYRYGDRVYLTRQGVSRSKNSFDDYRLLLKFHHDTLTGMEISPSTDPSDLPKIARHALDNGISFAELPASILESDDQTVKQALSDLDNHMGYQLIGQKLQISKQVHVGEPLKASFVFINAGDAPAIRPDRNFDKDTASSFRVLVELRDGEGKPVLQNVHTPPTPTNGWESGKPIAWDEELKMVDGNKHELPAGQYTAYVSIIDPNSNRKIQFLNATSKDHITSTETLEVGKIVISDSVADSKVDAGAKTALEGKNQ